MAIQRKVGQKWRASRTVNHWNTTVHPGIYEIVGFQRRRHNWNTGIDEWPDDSRYIRLRRLDTTSDRDICVERDQFRRSYGWELIGDGDLQEKNFVVSCRRCGGRDVLAALAPPVRYECPRCLRARGRSVPAALREKLNVGPVVVSG